MKKILLIIFTLSCFLAEGQILQKDNTYGREMNRLLIDSLMALPSDTLMVPTNLRGYPWLSVKGDTAYLWSSSQAKWIVLTISGSGFNNGITELLSPGRVVYSGTGLKFYITESLYRIEGIVYETDQDSVTLSPADPDDPRKDVIYLATTGVEVLTGTPAGPAAEPQLDADQIKLTVVDVPALATTPGITQQILYDDHTGESNVTNTGTTTDPDNVTNVFRGTKSLNVTTLSTGDIVYIEHPTLAWDVTGVAALQFFIKLKAILPSLANIRIGLLNGSTLIGNEVTLVLNKSSLQYQPGSIPVSAFGNLTQNAFTRVRIRYTSAVGNHAGFYLDYMYLQSGIVQPGPAGAVNSVTLQGPAGWTFPGPTTGDVIQTIIPGGTSTQILGGDGVVKTDSAVKYIGTINSLTKSANGAVINTLTNEIVMQESDASNPGLNSAYRHRQVDTLINQTIENGDNTLDTLVYAIDAYRTAVKSIKDSTGIGVIDRGGYLAIYATGGGGSQDLQSVTDIGNITTNIIKSTTGVWVSDPVETIQVVALSSSTNGTDAGGDLQLKAFNNDSTVTLRTLSNITDNRTVWLPDESDTLATRGFARSVGGGGGGSGTVTNVATGYGLSGGPITTTGTIVADTTSGSGLVSKDRLAATIALIDTSNILIERAGDGAGQQSHYIVGDTTLFLKDFKNSNSVLWSTDNDSNLIAKVDTFVIATKARVMQVADSLAAAITAGAGNDTYTINVFAGTYTAPTDAATVYFTSQVATPTNTATFYNQTALRNCTITGASIDTRAATAGSNEGWSIYIRVNDATDYLIATVSSATQLRTWQNSSLNISLTAGDKWVIKMVNPTWATEPATVVIQGYVEFTM